MRRISMAIGTGIFLLVACGKSSNHPHSSLAAGAGGDAAGAPNPGGAGASEVAGEAGNGGVATSAGAGGDVAEAGAAGEATGGMPSGAEGGAAGAPIDDWVVGGEDAGGAPAEGAISGKIELAQRPAPGAIVRINGVSKVTEADGSFAFDDVAPEYDLTVIYEPSRDAKVIEGLTTRNPVVVLGSVELNRSATVAGQLSGGAGVPLPTGYGASVAVVFPDDVIGSAPEHHLISTSSYELAPSWAGPPSIDAELVALQWQNGFTGPKAFTGFARKSLKLENSTTIGDANGSVPATNLELVEPTTTSYAGILGSEGAFDDLIPLLQIGPFSVGFVDDVGDFSVLTPDVDLPTGIHVLAVQDVVRQMEIYVPKPAPGAEWRVTVPGLPTLLAPNDQAAVTLATSFQWQDMPKHALAHSSWFIDGWNVERVTRSASTTIPDLTADGVPTTSPVVVWFLDAIGPADKPEQSLGVQAHRLRHQRVRSFSTYLARTLELTE